MKIAFVGGGNMGALNAAREVGPLVGLIVLLIDIAKGAGIEVLGVIPERYATGK